jgi:hypothetical protein
MREKIKQFFCRHVMVYTDEVPDCNFSSNPGRYILLRDAKCKKCGKIMTDIPFERIVK